MMHPDDGSKLFLGSDQGLHLTNDGFETSELILELPITDIEFSTESSDIVFAGDQFGNFYRSTDAGDSFDLIEDLGAGPNMIAPNVLGSVELVHYTSFCICAYSP